MQSLPRRITRCIPLHASNSTHSTVPLPQHRKINCTLQNARAKKKLRGGLRCGMRGWRLKVCKKLGVGAKPATPCEDRQLRKINCTLQNALAEKKDAWWVAMCHAGFAPKAPAVPPRRALKGQTWERNFL